MKSINEYKRRFNMLLESKMGDVKPLISEAPQFEEFVVPTLDMLKEVFAFATTMDGSSNNEKLNVKTSLDGNEYKITLPEGVYNPSELVDVTFVIDKTLMILPPNESNEHSRDNVAQIGQENKGDVYGIYFTFILPRTQEQFSEKPSYYGYVDVKCKNVRGGKLRFSVEVASGSEIYEPVSTPTPTPNENYKPVPTPTYNPDYKG